MRCIISILFICLSWNGYGQLEKSDYNFTNVGMAFLSVVADARAGGMGEIGVASLSDSYSHQHNASKYIFLGADKNKGINIFYLPWLRHLINDMSIAGASGYYLIGKDQSISSSFRYFSMGELQQTDANQQPIGIQSPNEMAFDIAYARLLGKHFSMSLGFRFAASSVVQEYRKTYAMAFDLGAYYVKQLYFSQNKYTLGLGFVVSNVGNKLDYGYRDMLFLPSDLKLGVNLSTIFLKDHLFSVGIEGGKYLVSSNEANRKNNVLSNIMASFKSGEIERLFFKVGCEYSFQNVLFGRLGYFNEGKSGLQREYLTCGTGVKFLNIHLDCAYLISLSQNHHPLDNSFRLSAGFDF